MLDLTCTIFYLLSALEWMLSQIGVIETTLEGDPQKKFIHSNGEMKILSRDRRNARDSDSDSDDD